MSQYLELPEPIFRALHDAARQDGTTPVGWIATRLPQADSVDDQIAEGKTMADLLAGRTGTVASGGKNLAAKGSDALGDYLEEKRRKGHL